MSDTAVLLIEDNPSHSRRIADYLQAADRGSFRLTTVPSLAQGVQRLGEERFDVALLDLSLPDAIHLEAVLKVTRNWPELPVVVLTSLDDAKTALASLDHGAQDFLAKDRIDADTVVRSLRYAIQRKRIAVELERSVQRNQALVAAMTSIVWSTDARGDFVEEQASWKSYTGQAWPEQRGQGWLDAVREEDRERVKGFWNAADSERQPREFPVHLWHAPTQRHRRCLARVVPIVPHGQEVSEWVGTITDVEDKQRAEEALRRAERLASLGTLAAGIAHEINNPILAAWTSAEAALNVMDKPGSHDLLRNCLENVIQSAKRCRDTVENVLQLARHGEVEFYRCNLSDIIQRSILETEPYAATYANTITWSGEKELPDVKGNSVQIQQVLVTLLRNAIEANSVEGKIEVETAEEEENVLISVVDQGCGMTEAEQQRAFDPFFTSGKERGTGLGLSIAHAILEGHGGSIHIDSRPGSGSTAVVVLPKENRIAAPE